MEANKRNINQPLNSTQNNSKSESESSSPNQVVETISNTISNHFQYHQNKQLILINTNEENNSSKRSHSSIHDSSHKKAQNANQENSNSKKVCKAYNEGSSSSSDLNEPRNNLIIDESSEQTSAKLKNDSKETLVSMSASDQSSRRTEQPIIKVKCVLTPLAEFANSTQESYEVNASYCKLCSVILSDEPSIKQHLFTLSHRTKLSQLENVNIMLILYFKLMKI